MQAFDPAGQRVLAIVPHQDDEVIGMGGQIAMACRTARSVHVVLVTDGAADAGSKCLCGLAPCFAFGPHTGSGSADHDATLERGSDGGLFHTSVTAPAWFRVEPDAEREPGFACEGWGKQRTAEFAQVCRTLGVPGGNTIAAYWDPLAPERIKDGQVACAGRLLTPMERAARYARVASHYITLLRPQLILTMAPYEYAEPPNDHWAVSHGVCDAARSHGGIPVRYSHSGALYQRVRSGAPPIGRPFELPSDIWDIKRRALAEYMRWDPDRGRYATALHSVPRTFEALLDDAGRTEYISDQPEP
jgi:LmbE family N-acetylglucosaminyl deacetylase